MRRPASGAARTALVVAMLASACAPRPRMCTASNECAAKSACVSGRCQLEKVNVKPAVDSARRLVVRPVDIAYLQSGDRPAEGALPTVFALGKNGAKLFLRFAVAPTGSVVEAYVVLHRASVVDDDPASISLHATRIVEPWAGGSVSWTLQPRSTEARSPTTTVEPAGSPLVRIDVRELVRQWARRDPSDHGIAIVAENETRTGTTFALSGVAAETDTPDARRAGLRPSGSAPEVEPYLELYVR